MDKICFLKYKEESNETIVNAILKNITENTIRIEFEKYIPDEEILLSGFDIINEFNGFNMTENYYHNYNTLFRKINENTVILSNDESVYVEPEEPEFSEIKPSEPYTPTLKEIKQAKINNFSRICNERITNGVYIEIDGTIEHFSYSEEDQINLKEIFDLSVQTNVPMYYHADGENCKLYTVEQIINIYTSATTNKMHHKTYFNQMRAYINSLETSDDVELVTYGDTLTDEYLESYNKSMEQAKLALESLLTKKVDESLPPEENDNDEE